MAPSASTVDAFSPLFDMIPVGDDAWSAPNLVNPWGQVYGGQVAAQGLWAAGATVDPAYVPHSLHAYFIRRGVHDEPVRYEVDRIRDGRSFVTRRVVAVQSSGAILNLSASFQRPEEAPAQRTIRIPTDVSDPDLLPETGWGSSLARRDDKCGLPRSRTWLQVRGDYDDTPLMQAVAHTFASDDLPTEAVEYAHPLGRGDYGDFDAPRKYMGASLDHAVWFHDLAPATAWTLHDFTSTGVANARGHATGELWSRDGRHVATVAQEVLLRVAR